MINKAMLRPAANNARLAFKELGRRKPNATSLFRIISKNSAETCRPSLLPFIPRRSLSSSSESSHDTMEKRWQDSTAKLLNDKNPGSFDSLQWQLAQTMIVYWAEKGPYGIHKSFELLERLVEEAALNQDAELTMGVYIIHAVLKGWNRLFKKGKINLLPSQVLQKIDDYISKSPNCFEPNIATYTIILDGASHCPNPQERLEFTEALLVRLITESSKNPKVRPTVVTFSAVINAFARSGSVKAAERAESLLQLAQSMHDDGWIDIEPNAIMYTSVINAWARAGNPSKAERLVKKMYQDYTLNANENVKPNLWSFNTVLSAWSKSSSSSAVESAEKLLRKMVDLKEAGVIESGPDAVSYNCLLQTLARRRKTYTNASLKAESLVEEMLETASTTGDKSVLPNEITFTALFKILNACGSVEDKAEKAQYWVNKAKQDPRTDTILKDSFVIDQLQQLGWADDRTLT